MIIYVHPVHVRIWADLEYKLNNLAYPWYRDKSVTFIAD